MCYTTWRSMRAYFFDNLLRLFNRNQWGCFSLFQNFLRLTRSIFHHRPQRARPRARCGWGPRRGPRSQRVRGRSERLKKFLHNLSYFRLHNLSDFGQKYVPMLRRALIYRLMECLKLETRFPSKIRTLEVWENIVFVMKKSLMLWCKGVFPVIYWEKSQKGKKIT